MRTEIELIILNLNECFDGKPWYGIPIMEKLNDIPWQRVNHQRYGSKSIAVLVQHIINWRIFILKKLEGDEKYNIIIDGENDWDEVLIHSNDDWQTLKTKLQSTQDELVEVLASHADTLLDKKVPGKDYVFGPILSSITQHDIYHLGQIAMLNAMQQH